MKMKSRLWAALAMAAITAPAAAQVKRAGAVVNSPAVVPITLPDGTYITPPATVAVDATGTPIGPANPLPTGGVREAIQLLSSNTPATSVVVYGGDYILAQTCSSYGTLQLQVRGPDATNWITIVTKTASDTGSGTGVALGSYAVVRVTVSGTSGCFASLSRVPA